MGAIAVALLPLGILALAVAVANYRSLVDSQDRLARARLEALREAAGPNLASAFAAMRASALLANSDGCEVGLKGLAATSRLLSDLVLLDDELRPICSSFPRSRTNKDTSEAEAAAASGAAAIRDESSGDLFLVVRQPGIGGKTFTVAGRVPARETGALVDPRLVREGERVTLSAGGATLASFGTATNASEWSRVTAPIEGGIEMTFAMPRPQVTSAQALGVALPALMWTTAIAICWVAIGTIIVQPLARMREAVERYAAGNRTVRTSAAAGSGRELLEFARAFDSMADQADRHELEIQAALAKQQALTREVHHRVKNNLQIVSSLLSLQARGVQNPEVADAYALIRQRVMALSLVHRWIYADAAEAGVDLRGLLTDLCASLNQSFDRGNSGKLTVHCRSKQMLVHQDTALPLAFLISEMTAAAAAAGSDALFVSGDALGVTGELSLMSSAFATDDPAAPFDSASRRIIDGLTRQLRTDLRHDPSGQFTIIFPLLDIQTAVPLLNAN